MKKGISLIVLVITIIVMIILAASVIIAMNNNGVIDRASQAVQLTDEKQVQDLAALAWAEAYLDEDRTDTMEKVVKDALAAQGVTDANWNISVSDTGVVVTSKNAKITFKVGGASYEADAGMTWAQFVTSSYATGNFDNLSTTIEYDGGTVKYNNVAVKPEDKIINGAEYDRFSNSPV